MRTPLLTLALAASVAAQSMTSDTRHTPLDEQPNFRDIGGYATEDGRTVKTGLLFRSGELCTLTDNDVDTLESIGVVTVVSFLTNEEIKAHGPDRVPPETTEVSLPIDTDGALAVALIEARETGDFSIMPPKLNTDIHRMLIDGGREQYAEFIRLAADPDNLPLVFHCSHGVHRTGVATALLLSAAGVEWDDVRDDYMLSNTYRAEEVEHRLSQLRARAAQLQDVDPDNVDMTNIEAFYILEPHYIDAALDQINAEFGSINVYLTEGLGLTESELNAMRNVVLEPTE